MNSQTWVFFRGLAREHGHWGAFPEEFKKSFPGSSVFTIDLPGTGDYCDLESPTTISGIFQFAREQAMREMTSAGLSGSRVHILAISLGGMVAMEWLRRFPEELAECVLINSSSQNLSSIHHRLRWQIWPDFVRLISIQSPREREKALIELLMNNEEARERALPIWTKIAQERPIGYGTLFKQLLAASRFKSLSEPVKVPVLVLNSLGDRLVDPSCSSVLSEKWKWPIARHPWAGHDLPWDDPEWIFEKIKSFQLLK